MIFIYICSHGRRHFKDLKIRFSSVNNLKKIKNRRIAIVDFKRIAKISGERKKSLKYQKRHFFVRKRKIFNSFRLFQSKRNPKSVISTINHFQSWKENDNNRLCHSHCGFERFIGYFETYFFFVFPTSPIFCGERNTQRLTADVFARCSKVHTFIACLFKLLSNLGITNHLTMQQFTPATTLFCHKTEYWIDQLCT